MVFTAIFFQMLVYGAALSSFSFWVTGWIHEFHAPRASIMYCLMLSYVISALVAPLAGAAMERWPFRNVVLAGLCFFSLGYSLLPLTTAPWQIVAIYGVSMGTALACCGPVAAQTLAAKWFTTRRGFALGMALTGTALGGVVMAPLVTFLLNSFEWRKVALIMAATGVCTMPIIWALVRNPPPSAQDAADSATLDDTYQWTTKEILLSRNFWAMVITSVPVCAAFQGVGANFSLLMADEGIPAQTAAFLLSLIGIFSVIGKPIVGRLSDRYDHRAIIVLASVLTGSGYLLLLSGTHPTYPRLLSGAVLVSTTSAFFFPMQGAIIGRYFGVRSFGRIIGLLNFFYLFGALGPPIAGLTRDHLGSYRIFVIGAAAVPFLASPFIFWLRGSCSSHKLKKPIATGTVAAPMMKG